jgi:hypothetical protein
MGTKSQSRVDVTEDLLDTIRSFPTAREVEHCGTRFQAPPFDFNADCPQCGARIKLRSFSGVGEVEDVFDAVFEWMNQPGAMEAAARRRATLEDDE